MIHIFIFCKYTSIHANCKKKNNVSINAFAIALYRNKSKKMIFLSTLKLIILLILVSGVSKYLFKNFNLNKKYLQQFINRYLDIWNNSLIFGQKVQEKCWIFKDLRTAEYRGPVYSAERQESQIMFRVEHQSLSFLLCLMKYFYSTKKWCIS